MTADDPLLVLDLTIVSTLQEVVREAVREVIGATTSPEVEGMLPGPIEVHVHVLRERPKSHYGTGLSEGLLRESAEAYPMRLGVSRGMAVVEGCEGVVWRHGALSALLVTCEWASINAIHIRIRQPPAATVGDLIAWDMEEPPVPRWTSAV
jgi:hypothetical protein